MIKPLIAFFGTPDFAAKILQDLIDSQYVNISFVLTQKDKLVGRKQILTPSPVKIIAQKNNVPVFDDLNQTKEILAKIDLVLVFAYGKIIPKEYLDLPKYGFFNIHPSLLPKYRGPSPIAYAILNQEKETGVSIIKLDEKMDHGSIITQEKYQILENDTRKDLEKKLPQIGLQIFLKEIPKIINNSLSLTIQKEENASFSKILKKEDGFIEINELKKLILDNPHKLFAIYKAFIDWPGIWTKININNEERRLKITSINFVNEKLTIEKVQIEGKNEINFIDFNKNYSIF